MTVPKMRTAEGVLAEIRAIDPETAITLHRIRLIIRTEKVPVLCAGKKKLVSVDAVLEYFAAGGGDETETTPTTPLGLIRRVAV